MNTIQTRILIGSVAAIILTMIGCTYWSNRCYTDQSRKIQFAIDDLRFDAR